MITTSITHWCPHCRYINIVKNGHTRHGNQRCLCHDCGKTRDLLPKRTADLRDFLEKALCERLSLRGIARIFSVAVQTVLLMLYHLARALPPFKHSVAPARTDDVLELDELHSFVYRKKQKRWLSEAISLADCTLS